MQVDWVGAEATRIPDALSLALQGKPSEAIARQLGIKESLLLEGNLETRWQAVDKRILAALVLAVKKRSIPEIAIAAGVPRSSLYSIRKWGPYEHRIRSRA